MYRVEKNSLLIVTEVTNLESELVMELISIKEMYESGNIKGVGFVDELGRKQEEWKYFSDDEFYWMVSSINYVNGRKDGEARFYEFEPDVLSEIVVFKDDELISCERIWVGFNIHRLRHIKT